MGRNVGNDDYDKLRSDYDSLREELDLVNKERMEAVKTADEAVRVLSTLFQTLPMSWPKTGEEKIAHRIVIDFLDSLAKKEKVGKYEKQGE